MDLSQLSDFKVILGTLVEPQVKDSIYYSLGTDGNKKVKDVAEHGLLNVKMEQDLETFKAINEKKLGIN